MIKLPLVDRVKFIVERQFVKGAGFQLLIVAAVIGLMALLGGMALRLGGAGEGFFDAVWWAFLRMTDPGYLGDDEGAWRRIVSTVLTVSGYVVFLGALVAIMTQWLIARMREFERGLTPVALRQHAVIVGWTNRTLPLLRELVGSERAREQFQSGFGIRRLRAVVLSEDVSPAQAQALRDDSGLGRLARRVVLRYGSPLEEEAIQRAGCLNAAVVIMPTDFARADSLVSADVATI
ncbi:MAG: ion channel DMI1, partial [Gammaproteobacteria bacterium]|nr:ion channel DMI1 [Gammaproteobacteria bacterium]